ASELETVASRASKVLVIQGEAVYSAPGGTIDAAHRCYPGIRALRAESVIRFSASRNDTLSNLFAFGRACCSLALMERDQHLYSRWYLFKMAGIFKLRL